MPSPIVTSSLISAGGSLLGGALSSGSASKAANKDYRRQKEFAKNSIKWRVEDAKRAGLHPLFALGGGASFQPSMSTGGGTDLGSGISQAASSLGDAYAASKAPKPGTPIGTLGKQTLLESQSRVRMNDAETALRLSQAKRMEQQSNFSQDSGIFSGPGGSVPESMVAPGRVTPKAPDVRSRAPGQRDRQAGKNPLFQRYQYGNRSDQWIDLPYSDEGPLEEMGPGKLIATIIRALQNRAKSAPLPKRRKRRTSRGYR